MAIRILSEPAEGEMATHPASCHPLQSLCDAKGLLRGTGRLRSHISRLMRRVIRNQKDLPESLGNTTDFKRWFGLYSVPQA